MIDWNAIDEVFLDMDGTLLDLHFDNYFWREHLPARYAQLNGVNAKEVRDDLHGRYQRMRGTLDWYCLEYWQTTLAVDILDLKKELMQKIQFRPGAEAFLQWLKRSDKRVTLVSNAHRWSIDLKFEHLQMHPYFDQVCSAHDHGYPKEDQRFWQCFQQQSGFNPERTVFIDDNLEVLDSADEFGIAQLFAVQLPDLTGPVLEPSKYTQVIDFEALTDGR